MAQNLGARQSPRGRDFAAMHAIPLSQGSGEEGKRKFREDIRQRAVKLAETPTI